MEYTNIQQRHEEFKYRYLAAKNGNDLVELHFDIMQFIQEYEETVPVCLRGADFINADSYAHFLKDLCAEKLKVIARQVQVIDPISAAALEVLTDQWFDFSEKQPAEYCGILITLPTGKQAFGYRVGELVRVFIDGYSFDDIERWKFHKIHELTLWKPLN